MQSAHYKNRRQIQNSTSVQYSQTAKYDQADDIVTEKWRSLA